MKKHKGFTLIENIVIIFVLALVIAIALPQLVTIKSKTTKQLLLRKAITSYQVVLTKELISSTGIRTTNDFDEYLSSDKYEAIIDRFNVKSKDCTQDSCKFSTESDVYWDVTNPSKVVISLSKSENPTLALASNEKNTNVFLIPYEIVNGSVKILLTKDVNYRDAAYKTQTYLNSD